MLRTKTKTDHIYFAQFFFVAENIGLFSLSRFIRTFYNEFLMISAVAMNNSFIQLKGCYSIELKFGYFESEECASHVMLVKGKVISTNLYRIKGHLWLEHK